MSFSSKLFRMSVLSAFLVLMSFSATYAQDGEVSFTVYNKTNSRITRLLVADPGKKTWSYFDIGKGIAPGGSMVLAWDKSAYNEDCVQWIKAVYADKSQSPAVKFDFCEDDLELEFTE